MMYAALILLVAIRMAASYAHGRGDDLDGNPKKAFYESKGVMVTADSLAFMLVGWLLTLTPWGLLLGILPSAVYWLDMRRSWHAQAELKYMARQADGKLSRIWKNYIRPTAVGAVLTVAGVVFTQQWVLGLYLVAMAASFASIIAAAKLYRNDAGERAGDNRQVVELANGLHGGVVGVSILHLGSEALKLVL